MTTYPCGCDTEEPLPCEEHLVIVVAREGASLRTADELVLQFIVDAQDVAEAANQTIKLAPWGEDVVKQAGEAMDDGDNWLADDTLSDHLHTVANQMETELAGLDGGGFYVHWDDGFLIYRATGPLAEEVAG
jgi:hypothetical protein